MSLFFIVTRPIENTGFVDRQTQKFIRASTQLLYVGHITKMLMLLCCSSSKIVNICCTEYISIQPRPWVKQMEIKRVDKH